MKFDRPFQTIAYNCFIHWRKPPCSIGQASTNGWFLGFSIANFNGVLLPFSQVKLQRVLHFELSFAACRTKGLHPNYPTGHQLPLWSPHLHSSCTESSRRPSVPAIPCHAWAEALLASGAPIGSVQAPRHTAHWPHAAHVPVGFTPGVRSL